MISLKLNSGQTTTLTPISEDGVIFELIDKEGTTQLIIRKEGNRFIWEDKENINEEEDTLRQKLDALYILLENENTIGIENNEDDSSADPFDPDEISINTKTFTMDACIRRLIQGTIILNPDFHRQEIWTIDKKSRLIESLMLKIPIPMFYVSSDEMSNLTVVDGLQRFSTIRDFILGTKYLETKDEDERGNGFRLSDLEFWKEYEGKNFKELPTHIVNRILDTEFTFTIISPGTPEEVRRNIFKRINTGGLPLSSQEIRNALYIGQSTTLLNELAVSAIFKKATNYSIKSMRMEDNELILRFISFLIRPYSSFTALINEDTWLSDTMIIINALPDLNTRELKKQTNKSNSTIEAKSIIRIPIDSIKEKFSIAMERAHKLFGMHAFRKEFSDKAHTPINKSLFETWSVSLSEMDEQQFNRLYENRHNMMNDYKKLMNNTDFVSIISRADMKPPSVKKRFETIQNLIQTYSQ